MAGPTATALRIQKQAEQSQQLGSKQLRHKQLFCWYSAPEDREQLVVQQLRQQQLPYKYMYVYGRAEVASWLKTDD